MLEYFLAFINNHKLIDKGERTLLAISGGVDSMVMATLFLQSDYPFAVIHVNFGLRGKESDLDESLVRTWCADNKVNFYVKHAPKAIFQGNDSVQMAARDFRYRIFRELMDKKGFQKLATAHHLDDSLETTLFNFTKGTGLRGLRGIQIQNELTIRPLLFTGKDEIIAFAKEFEVPWREDASNEKDAYHRNRIRHHIIPVLKEINPGLLKSYQRVTDRVQDNQDLIDQVVKGIVTNHQKEINGISEISLAWMAEYGNPRAILLEMVRPFGFEYNQVRLIEEAIMAEQPGKLFYSDSHVLNVDRERLIIKERELKSVVDFDLLIPGETQINNHYLVSSVIEGNDFNQKADASVAYLDFDKIKNPVITGWAEGDTFHPLGMDGKKKVSDFMIDSKIPLTLKGDVLILRSENEIAWIVGYRLDDRFKVTPKTSRMLRLQLHQDV